MAFVQHVPDWLKRRLPFHIQAFNIANYTLATMAAWGVAHEMLSTRTSWATAEARQRSPAWPALRPSSSALNHACSRRCSASRAGISFRESGLFTYENLSTDLVLGRARRRASRCSGTTTRG